MAFVVYDRVRETTATTGTGTVTLDGAVSGYQAFSVIGNANNTYYTIANRTGTEWETGVGTYTSSGTTLSRDTVISSSNSGSLVNFSVGTKDVFCSVPATRALTNNSYYPKAGLIGAPQGIVAPYIIYSNGAAVAMAASSAAQSIFPSSPSLTLNAGSQYQLEYMFLFNKTASTTSHNCAIGFATSGTGNSIYHSGFAAYGTTATSVISVSGTTNPYTFTNNVFATQILSGNIASVNTFFMVTGCGVLNTSNTTPGTLTPQFKTSATLSGGNYSLVAGSYIKLMPRLQVQGTWT